MSKTSGKITLNLLEKKVYDGLDRYMEAWVIKHEKEVDINSLLNDSSDLHSEEGGAQIRQSIIQKGGKVLEAIASRLSRRIADQPALVEVRYIYSPTASGMALSDIKKVQDAPGHRSLRRASTSVVSSPQLDDDSLEGLKNALTYMEISQPVVFRCRTFKVRNGCSLGESPVEEPISNNKAQEVSWADDVRDINEALNYLEMNMPSDERGTRSKNINRNKDSKKSHKKSVEGKKEHFVKLYDSFGRLDSVQALDRSLNSKNMSTSNHSADGVKKGSSQSLQVHMIDDQSHIKNANSAATISKLMRDPSTEGRTCRHIFVFANGMLGKHTDLRNVMQEVQVCFPDCTILPSMSNQGKKTLGDIHEMGARLADEILGYLQGQGLLNVEEQQPFKLSFVGYSLGNIIIRSALSHEKLKPYRENLELYVSLAGPHLGVTGGQTALMNSSIWVAKHFSHSKAIRQLTLSDSDSFERCYLYRLASSGSLQAFKYIVLVASQQDLFVPAYSARCQPHESCTPKDLLDHVMQMARCLLANIITSSRKKLLKYNVIFPERESKKAKDRLNKAIGRSAHIEFLKCRLYGDLLWKSLQKHLE